MYIAVIAKQDKKRFNLALSTDHHGGRTHHRREPHQSGTRSNTEAPADQPPTMFYFVFAGNKRHHYKAAKLRLKLWWANKMPTPVRER